MTTIKSGKEWSATMSNKWLDTTVQAYNRYFGETKNPIVYEVGSRDGKDGVELAERILDGPIKQLDHSNIILFEPNPPQAELIHKAYPDAVVLQIAASDKDGTAKFMAIDDPTNIAAVGSSSMDLKRRYTKPGKKTFFDVNTRRLDGIIREFEHVTIDVMKIDAEGYSWEILQGLGERLHDVLVFHVETEILGSTAVTNKTNRDVFKFMRDAGFLCYALEYEWGGLEDQVWVNAERISYAG